MATIGLKDVYTALITEDANGYETYGTPEKLAPAISVEMDINYDEYELPADDVIFDGGKQFIDGTFNFDAAEITSQKASDLTGAAIDNNGCLIDAIEDTPPYRAVGFKSLMHNGKYKYVWLYRVKFSVITQSYQTKGKNRTYNTPKIEGKIYARNKPDSRGKTIWRNSVNEGESNASATVISNWYSSVPEPSFTTQSSTT